MIHNHHPHPTRLYPNVFLALYTAQFISAECHEKASSLVVESVTKGCSAWLRFEPDVVALSILLLAIGTTSSRHELVTRVSLCGSRRCSACKYGHDVRTSCGTVGFTMFVVRADRA